MQLTLQDAQSPYTTIKKLHLNPDEYIGKEITLRGSCTNVRKANDNLMFIELCDGSTIKTLQCVLTNDIPTLAKHCTIGATIQLTGTVVKSRSPKHIVELHITNHILLGAIDSPDEYLFKQQYISHNILRSVPEQRHHAPLFLAIQIIKQSCYKSLHEIMDILNIGEVQPTLLTSNACEDGANPFTIGKDFFNKKMYLSVSSQLHLEATVLGTKRDGYCMTTACRAEPSETSQHVAEFLMPEWELIGGGIKRNMAVTQTVIQHIINSTLINCINELTFLNNYHTTRLLNTNEDYLTELSQLKGLKKKKYYRGLTQLRNKYINILHPPNLITKLTNYVNNPFVVITHRECVERILTEVHARRLSPEYRLGYDSDLQRIHEHWICKVIGSGLPVFVTEYPKKVKAFYMPLVGGDNDHVDCFDLLMPDIGEVVGGSQRIDDAQTLIERMDELKISKDELDWYIKLRRDASLPHGGAGMGFSRLLMAITGINNIKDLQEFPRAFNLDVVG